MSNIEFFLGLLSMVSVPFSVFLVVRNRSLVKDYDLKLVRADERAESWKQSWEKVTYGSANDESMQVQDLKQQRARLRLKLRDLTRSRQWEPGDKVRILDGEHAYYVELHAKEQGVIIVRELRDGQLERQTVEPGVIEFA